MNHHAIPRYLPHLDFPPYAYVPGLSAHPKSDPKGHGCPGPDLAEACHELESRWRDCELYLWGFDLFNHGYYWEAHEAWEEAWIAAGRSGETADFVKGLIKLAAAGVKAREGRPTGVERHARRAADLFLLTSQHGADNFCGCNLQRLRGNANDLIAGAEQIATAPDASNVQLNFTISLQGLLA